MKLIWYRCLDQCGHKYFAIDKNMRSSYAYYLIQEAAETLFGLFVDGLLIDTKNKIYIVKIIICEMSY